MLGLLSMANKTAGQLTDDELTQAAGLIAGSNAPGLVSFFKILRDAEPGTKVAQLLASPSANEILQSATKRLNKATDEKESGLFCRCPNCQFPFITE